MKQPLVQMRGIVKKFPGVVANDHVDLDLFAGEIHALLGEIEALAVESIQTAEIGRSVALNRRDAGGFKRLDTGFGLLLCLLHPFAQIAVLRAASG